MWNYEVNTAEYGKLVIQANGVKELGNDHFAFYLYIGNITINYDTIFVIAKSEVSTIQAAPVVGDSNGR